MLFHRYYLLLPFIVCICVIADHQNNFSFSASAPTLIDTLPNTSAKQNVDSSVAEKVEVQASVDKEQWRHHLEKSLQPVIEKAARKGMPNGTYVVNTMFIVEKDGTISDIHVMNDPGYGVSDGVVKIFRTAPKWTPGSINGRSVRSYHTQPITFNILNQ